MKKLVLALVLVFALTSVSFAGLRMGKFGIDFDNLLVGDPIGDNNAYNGQIPSIFYQFTEDLSGAIGLIYSAKTEDDPGAKTDTTLGLKLKGVWNLGSGKAVPHLGAEVVYISYTDGNDDDVSDTTLQLAILYGVEVMWLPNCSVSLDVRLLDYWTNKDKGMDNGESDLALLSGTTLGVRWYIY